MDVVLRLIEEQPVPGKRLGRFVEHDPRSRSYPARLAAAPAPLRTVVHRRYGDPFTQTVGSCTGEAVAGCLNTKPLHVSGGRMFRQADAMQIYERATIVDDFPGSYPPADTGSSGLAACKAAKEYGWISEYRHAFGIDEALRALQDGPLITGVDWYEGMDETTEQGFVRPTGRVRGGHEFEVLGYVKAVKPYVVCANSWGRDYGLNGRFRLFVEDWATLLAAQGDATILIR